MSKRKCSVCGGAEFAHKDILWPSLIAEWGLDADEVRYVNRQQGEHCIRCGSNLRSIVLADALLSALGTTKSLLEAVKEPETRHLRLLEINPAGSLRQSLEQMPGFVRGDYPEIDMQALPFPEDSFDIVTHSDTLEHVADPGKSLSECHRVLKPGGTLAFTVPIIVGRMTRSRAGLPKSYHGTASEHRDDLVVHTEFGSDAWVMVAKAGFSELKIFTREFPAAIALAAVK